VTVIDVARALVCSAALLLLASPARAQPVDDARVTELLAAARQAAQVQPAADAAKTDLRLDEVVARALEKNLDIAVERLGPPMVDMTVAALQSNYRPVLTSTLAQGDTVQLPRNQLTGGQRVQDAASVYNFGTSQLVPWGGGSLSVAWTNRRQESTSSFNTFNPQFNSTVSASLVQPLLRDFRIDDTRREIGVARIDREISRLQLRETTTNTIAAVKNAYWDLVYALEAVEVARRYLELAQKLVDDNKVRVEVGALAPLDVVQAQAEAATRRQLLAQAEAGWRTTELALKRLIVSGTDDPLWRARLNPIDRPTIATQPVNVEDALRNGLANRTDLAELGKTIAVNDLDLKFFRNQRLPIADIVANYGLQGIGGTQVIREGGLGGPVVDTIPGGYRDALRALTGRDYPTWSVQLSVSYPIGQSAADANYERTRIMRQQNDAARKALELQVATEITSAGLLVESDLTRVEAATAARQLAQKRLEAEQSKFEVGLTTNFFVVQAQRDLADAAISELRAALDYRKALVEFERAQYTPSGRSVSTGTVTPGFSGGGGAGVAGGGATTGGGTAAATGGTANPTGGGGTF
jgi:outer membrane protein